MINYTIVYLIAFRRYLRSHRLPDIPSELVGTFAALERQRCRLRYIRATVESVHPLIEDYLAHYINYLDTHLHFRPNPIHAVVHHHAPQARRFAAKIHRSRHTTYPVSINSIDAIRGVSFDSAILLDTHLHSRPDAALRTIFLPLGPHPGTFIIVHTPSLHRCLYRHYIFRSTTPWLIIPAGHTLRNNDSHPARCSHRNRNPLAQQHSLLRASPPSRTDHCGRRPRSPRRENPTLQKVGDLHAWGHENLPALRRVGDPLPTPTTKIPA